MLIDFIQNYILKLQNLKVLVVNLMLQEDDILPNIYADDVKILNF
jgi:hypothetical protein